MEFFYKRKNYFLNFIREPKSGKIFLTFLENLNHISLKNFLYQHAVFHTSKSIASSTSKNESTLLHFDLSHKAEKRE